MTSAGAASGPKTHAHSHTEAGAFRIFLLTLAAQAIDAAGRVPYMA